MYYYYYYYYAHMHAAVYGQPLQYTGRRRTDRQTEISYEGFIADPTLAEK